MKRLFLSLVVAMMCGMTGIYAQSNLVATLSRGASILTYYGEGALSEAYEDAEAGDVITLSSGTFNAVNIEKAITIRGAGIYTDGDISPTYITGTFTITVSEEISNNISIESVRCHARVQVNGTNFSSINFVKSYFEQGIGCLGCSAKFMSCVAYKLSSQYELGSVPIKSTQVICNSCVLLEPSSNGYYYSVMGGGRIKENCLIMTASSEFLGYSSFLNCIFAYRDGYSFTLPENSTATDCVAVNQNGTTDLFSNIDGSTDRYADSFESLFKTYTYDMLIGQGLPEGERFELTDAAAAAYLGNDGTQVGIYGGATPFNPIPTNPRINTFNVSSEHNNGTLTVKINVE